tara:strand:+ start:147 stop:1295 length:1149 start_codon:yes stop_codon:yes gene_type:complete
MILFLDKPLLRIIFDLLNYTILISILYFLFKKKIINQKDLIIYSLFSFSPFLINEVLVPYSVFWDQKRYVLLADSIRNNWLYGIFLPQSNEHIKVSLSSYIFALFPILTFNTINSVAFVNKGIYFLSLIYINNKIKINDTFKIFLLFTPSVLIYSSLSLRDILILSLMLLSFFLIVCEKRSYIGLVILILLLYIKPQNGLITFTSIFIYFLFNRVFNKNFFKTFIPLIILTLFLLYYFDEYIFDKFNQYRRGLYLEEYYQYRDLLSTKYYNNFFSIGYNSYTVKTLIISFFNFIIAPTFSVKNLFHLISSIEAFLILIFCILFFINQYSIDKKLTIFWILLLIIFLAVYSLLPFNDNAIVRYRFPVVIFILMCSYLTTKKYK